MAGNKRNRRTRPQPLYEQTAAALGELIDELEPGAYLPSEPELARELGVSRATLREAMRPIEARGRIVRRRGVGTYVTQAPKVIESGLEELQSIETLAARSGLRVEMGALTIHERPAGPADRCLALPTNEGTVLEISRVILAEQRPAAFLLDVIPHDLLPPEALSDGFRGSVLDLLLRRDDIALGHSRAEISATAAPRDIARQLHIKRGDVLLRLEACLYTLEGRAIDHSFSYFLPGTFRFHVVRRVGRSP